MLLSLQTPRLPHSPMLLPLSCCTPKSYHELGFCLSFLLNRVLSERTSRQTAALPPALPPASLRRLIASLVPTLSACFTKQGKHQNYLNDGLTGDAWNSSKLCKCWLLLLCLETFINEDGTSC